MDEMHQDAFKYSAKVIEVKDKPTLPQGETIVDGFGRKPEYEDRGIRKRAILATGKLDYAIENKIFPKTKNVEIIGSSSDHTIIDINDVTSSIKVGDILEFDLSYPALMYLTNSRYVTTKFV